MPPRKDKNKMIDAGECSAAAKKRKMIEILNGANGVPFTNPITEFPSSNILKRQRNLTRNTTVVGTDLQLSPPTLNQREEESGDDGFLSLLIPQQNFIISYHMNLMQQTIEDFWRRNLSDQIKKLKEFELKLKEKEEQADRFRQMYHHYEKRTFHLEEMLQQRVALERDIIAPQVAPQEEVQSCLVDLNSVQRMEDVKCKNCRSRPATMVWLPCRHLCVCLVCERRVKTCPMCSVKKSESFKINLP